MTSLPISHVTGTCCLGQQDRVCRYLGHNYHDSGKLDYHCCKTDESLRMIIDAEVKRFLDECQQKKLIAADQGVPLGNNCDGYSPQVG